MALNTFSLSSLPYMPLNPAWIEQSQAFTHADARLGTAYMRILLAAWRGAPGASIPHSHAYVAQVTGLPVDVVGQHFTVLTEGFELLDDGRLHHLSMSALAAEICDRYGNEIAEFALASAMTIQSPSKFGIVAAEKATATASGKRMIPKNFGYESHPELLEWTVQKGYETPEERAWLMGRFKDFIAMKNPAYSNWAAAFRDWTEKEISYGRGKPIAPVSKAVAAPQPLRASPFSRGMGSRAEAISNHNANAFARAPATPRVDPNVVDVPVREANRGSAA